MNIIRTAILPIFLISSLWGSSISLWASVDMLALRSPLSQDFSKNIAHHDLYQWFVDIKEVPYGVALAPELEDPICHYKPLIAPSAPDVNRHVVVDWGSSGIRFLIADAGPDGIVEHFRGETQLPSDYTFEDLPGRIAAWRAILWGIEAFFPDDQPIRYHAVATAGLRVAAAGEKMRDAVIELGVPVRIISQEEEGHLAVKSILYHRPELDLEEILVWDVGGKSMQWTAHVEGETIVHGSDGGVKHLYDCYEAHLGKKSIDSLEDLEVVREIARSFFIQGHPQDGRRGFEANLGSLQSFAQERQVYGVGPIHQVFIMEYLDRHFEHEGTAYTSDLIQSLLEELIYMDEDTILAQKNPRLHPHSKPQILLPMIFLLEAMNVLGVKTVTPINADNREGLLLEVASL